MRIKNYLLIMAGLVTALAVTGCNMSQDKKVEETRENVDKANRDLTNAQAEYDKEWRQFKSDAELKISANEKSIKEFKAEVKTAGKKFKVEYEKEVAVLEQKNIELKKIINEYKYQGKDKWEEFKRGFEHDMDVIGKAIKDLFAKND